MNNFGFVNADIVKALVKANNVDTRQYFIFTGEGDNAVLDFVRSETWYKGNIIKDKWVYEYIYSVQVTSYAEDGHTETDNTLLVNLLNREEDFEESDKAWKME